MSCKITVVTPSFDQARFLEETLRSVLSQREQIHEYFVIDGGSTDGSADIIQRYADRPGRGIDYWVSEKDTGQADAIHKGFSRATGDVLAWLNSDDVYLPGAIAKVRAAFDAHPDWDALTAWHLRMDADSRIVSMHRIPGENARLARWGVHHVNQQTCFFKRALYERVGPIDHSLHCVLDTELWSRMFDAGSTWGHIPQYLAGFRQHAAAKGSSGSEAYPREEQWMRQHYPQYNAHTMKHRAGLLAYRASQILTGRHVRAGADTRRFAGKMLDEIFGPHRLPGEPQA
ncbi:MAG: glycosyltransferase family 2 protein [Tepidisphaeraceae bacterium]